MPAFRYTSINGSAPASSGNGTGAGGVIEAADRPAAVRILLQKGITPTLVEPMDAQMGAAKAAPAKPGDERAKEMNRAAGHAATAGFNGAMGDVLVGASNAVDAAASRRRVMSLAETSSFIRELATAVQAGLPLVPALRTLAKQGRSEGQRAMLDHLIARVEQGNTLANAAQSWGRPFGDLLVSLIRAGESSGKLGEVLHQAADLLERDVALRRSLMSATLYPAILTVLTFGAITVVTTVIVPQVLKPFAGRLDRLPVPMKIINGFAQGVSQYWWLILVVLALLAVAWQRARQTEPTRTQIDRLILRLPLFGPVVRDALVARFTRTLGTLVNSGLPVLQALRLTGATITNKAMQGAVLNVCDEVASGKTIAEPLERTGLFPALLIQIVGLGERSGRLPELLGSAANALEGRTESRIKVITTVLPPILIVIVALMVGGVVAAIILTLLEMQNAVG